MRTNIQRVCPKCGKFLELSSPPYFKKRTYKCTDCAYSINFFRNIACPKCEHGKLKLIAEGEGESNGKIVSQEFIYLCDLCNEITITEDRIN
jgi:uncharacterized protein YbaR (Trm112 family)